MERITNEDVEKLSRLIVNALGFAVVILAVIWVAVSMCQGLN